MKGLTIKEIIELRLKCLEMFVTIGSKTQIEQDVVFKKAEIAWDYAVKPLANCQVEKTAKAST